MKTYTFILMLALVSFNCSNSNDDSTPPEENSTLLLKSIQWNSGYAERYFYNEENKLNIIAHNDAGFLLGQSDSTFIDYTDGRISKILKKEYEEDITINEEYIFNTFSSTSASGTRKIFTSTGEVYSDQTFEYQFNGDLLKSYTIFNLNGNVHFVQAFDHDDNGNLTEFNEISYDSETGVIIYEYDDQITQWDTSEDKKVTERLFSWDAEGLPGFYLSKSNCLNLITNSETYMYSFDYNNDGYVIKYNLSNGNFIDLDYY